MRNKNGVTHTGYVRGAMFGNDEKHVCFFTGMSSEQLFDLKCDVGRRWVTLFFTEDGASADRAAGWWELAEVRQVWHLHWRKIDHEQIVSRLHELAPTTRLAEYIEMHCEVFIKENPYYQRLAEAMSRTRERIEKGKNDLITAEKAEYKKQANENI